MCNTVTQDIYSKWIMILCCWLALSFMSSCIRLRLSWCRAGRAGCERGDRSKHSSSLPGRKVPRYHHKAISPLGYAKRGLDIRTVGQWRFKWVPNTSTKEWHTSWGSAAKQWKYCQSELLYTAVDYLLIVKNIGKWFPHGYPPNICYCLNNVCIGYWKRREIVFLFLFTNT